MKKFGLRVKETFLTAFMLISSFLLIALKLGVVERAITIWVLKSSVVFYLPLP